MRKRSFNRKTYNSFKHPFQFFLLVCFLFFNISCKNTEETKNSLAVIEKLIGNRVNDFELSIVENDSNEGDWFEVEASANKVKIKGTSNVVICYAAYSFLKDIGAVLVSWEGNRIDLPSTWPKYYKKESTPFKYRNYLNVCAYGYTTPWWDWQRWNREIDWMALHGINMPTAMEGQEIVWQQLWKEYGVTDNQLKEHFTGPAFLPWQRMGNINSHEGPLPQEWINKKSILQKKILQKMKALGMHPVVPAFSGYVPKAFAEMHTNSKISELSGWSGGGFKSTFLLDPKDPLFTEIGKRFIEIYAELYGQADFYLADSFNEITPPVSVENKNEELSDYGNAIFETINKAAPGATWVLQGWLFGNDKEFWTKEATKAFLSKVPNNKMIVQDFANDRYKVWENQEAFYGKQWTYGYVHNYGGSNPVYGDLHFYNTELKGLLHNAKKGNVVGYGVMPEGLNNNSVVYEYIYDLPWKQGNQPVNDWLHTYLKARYGKNTNDNVFKAWQLLKESVFITKYWDTRWWDSRAGAYLFFKRPTEKITEFEGNPGDKEKLRQAIDFLNEEADKFDKSNLYTYDLVNFSRHYYSLELDDLLIQCVKAYQKKELDKGDALYNDIETLALKIDAMLAGQKLNNLNSWLSDAWSYGDSNETSKNYLKNAKMLITFWGGEGHLSDYASRAWHGMYKEFYWQRWKQFLQVLRESVIANQPFNEDKERQDIQKWEIQWCESDKRKY